jgi:hypothetical protein
MPSASSTRTSAKQAGACGRRASLAMQVVIATREQAAAMNQRMTT